eukprot:356121-Chlamydomonas_euryale.AAC.5
MHGASCTGHGEQQRAVLPDLMTAAVHACRLAVLHFVVKFDALKMAASANLTFSHCRADAVGGLRYMYVPIRVGKHDKTRVLPVYVQSPGRVHSYLKAASLPVLCTWADGYQHWQHVATKRTNTHCKFTCMRCMSRSRRP